ncbi:MAG: choline ABC transporter ATP-binding protein [Pseudomonadales bacterium]|nr:choline ABC transporter ATP-binding protein [Pseudomonadales bacterium]NRA16890.1 choline ABC transporter ATP-binding protein [Oceanospirillaceae bacterium]
MSAISIRNVDVIFGNNTVKSLALLDQGQTRQQIIQNTGDTVGVQDASIEIAEGEICVLMGLSGSGKSSLLRAINGLNTISRGSLLVKDGEQMVDVASCDSKTLLHMRGHRISMVFQNFALMPWLSVIDNVAFGLEMQGMPKAERLQKALQQLQMVGLEQWADKLPNQLSGGMQQRVGLARAFAMDTDILLMDEPFSALDPLIRTQLQDELIELQQNMKKTIVFVSHDLDEALKIGSKIGIMESAKIIQYDTPENIVLNPANAYVQDFVAHTNPLNVLKGHSLMTPLATNGSENFGQCIDFQQQIKLFVDSKQQLLKVTIAEQPSQVQHCSQEMPIEQLARDKVTIVPADIGMRRAIEIKYHTGLPLILAQQQKILGSLNDQSFYHALLGKHFNTDFSGQVLQQSA